TLLLAPGEAVGVRERDALTGKEQRSEFRVEEVDPPHAHRADRVAVVAPLEGDEQLLLGTPHPAPVRGRDLQPDLDRGRAGVREEDLGEACRRYLDETL